MKNGNETDVDCGGTCPPCVSALVMNVPLISEATCELEATSSASDAVTGSYHFTPDPNNVYTGQEPIWKMNVKYTIGGLVPGDHKFHIHNLGNIWDQDGFSTEEHFVGAPTADRPAGRMEIGLLNNDAAFNSDGDNAANGEFQDTQAMLNGQQNFIGRAMVVHDVEEGTSALPRSAECVVGRLTDNPTIIVPDVETRPQRTICNFNPGNGLSAIGYIEFIANYYTQTEIRALISGLPASSSFKIQVYSKGTFIDPSNEVFPGTPLPSGRRTGDIGGSGYTFNSDGDGQVRAFLTDTVVKLYGPNSILGRAVFIQNSGGATLGQCIIGLTEGYDTYTPAGNVFFSNGVNTTIPKRYLPVRASAYLRMNNNGRGSIEFRQTSQSHPVYPNQVRVSYLVYGLTPSTDYAIEIRDTGNLGATPSAPNASLMGTAYAGYPVEPPVSRAAGTLLMFTTDGNGDAKGQVFDPVISLFNYNSILGRGVVVELNSTGAAVAWGIIGVTETARTQTVFDAPPITSAQAMIWGTQSNPSYMGVISFTQIGGGINVSYSVTIPAGTWNWHIHDKGDMIDNAGALATGTHFLGTQPARAGGMCETGAINNNTPLTSTGGTVTGQFPDNYISLNGLDSIIGRAFIIHDMTTPTIRVAQGVVAVVSWGTYAGPATEQVYLPSDASSTGDCNDCASTGVRPNSAHVISFSVSLLFLLAISSLFVMLD